MSNNDDSTSTAAQPLDFNSIFTTGEAPAVDDEWAAAVNGVADRAKDIPPSWREIRRQKWGEIEARYQASARDKETVCAWMAYKAALKVCKGWPAGSFDELVTEGYQAAVRRWPHYDPTKATTNGISGFLYKAALGRMRNAALELFTPTGKRKHRATDEIPTLVLVPDVAHVADRKGGAVTIPRDSETYYGVNYRNPATNTKSFKRDYVKTPRGPDDKQLTRLARIAAEIHVHRLLALLPQDDRDLITRHWGLDGVESATIEELAEYGECSEATVRRRIKKLLAELKARGTRSEQT